jgi:hypothetical protein
MHIIRLFFYYRILFIEFRELVHGELICELDCQGSLI